MERRIKDTLHKMLGGGVRFDCPMSAYTTFRIGGNAEALCRIQRIEDLRKVMIFIREERIPGLVVGKGSNLLVKDKGLEGVALILGGELARVEEDPEDEGLVVAGAGAPLAELLVHCRHRGWSGLEFLAGIPGSVGGAVVMNAGAFGGEVGDRVEMLDLLAPEGRLMSMGRRELKFSYRRLDVEEGAIIVRAHFRLEQASTESVGEQIAANLKRRREAQPMEYASAGSVFKNPPGDHAGRLIERAGLKGKRVGNAKISEEHANYIVNLGGATAKDVIALMDLAMEEVRAATGIELEPEIKVVGGAFC